LNLRIVTKHGFTRITNADTGEEIKRVLGVSFDHNLDTDVPIVSLTLLVDSLEIETDCEVACSKIEAGSERPTPPIADQNVTWFKLPACFTRRSKAPGAGHPAPPQGGG